MLKTVEMVTSAGGWHTITPHGRARARPTVAVRRFNVAAADQPQQQIAVDGFLVDAVVGGQFAERRPLPPRGQRAEEHPMTKNRRLIGHGCSAKPLPVAGAADAIKSVGHSMSDRGQWDHAPLPGDQITARSFGIKNNECPDAGSATAGTWSRKPDEPV